MEINPEIVELLDEKNMKKDEVLVYLLGLHFNLNVDFIPDIVKKKSYILGIINRDFENKGKLIWHIPLFKKKDVIGNDDFITFNTGIDPKWQWVVDEYRMLFMNIDGKRGGDRKSCVNKMKKFFMTNPEARKEDVINATNVYLDEFADGTKSSEFLTHADYFIMKSNRSLLEQYIEMGTTIKKIVPKSKHKGLQNY